MKRDLDIHVAIIEDDEIHPVIRSRALTRPMRTP